MASVTASIADFHLDSEWTVKSGAVTSQPTTVTATKQVTISGIPSGDKVTSAALTAATGNPLTGGTLKINGASAALNSSVSIDLSITGNGTYTVTFTFKANGSGSMSDGRHFATLSITGATVTVVHETPVDPEPDPDPETYIESEKLICVYPKKETSFLSNGTAVLEPVSCVVREVAAGEYELEMDHPLDPYGKWTLLTDEAVIRAPVPPTEIPEVTIPAVSVWQVKSGITTPLYSKLPSYTSSGSPMDTIARNPTAYLWDSGRLYKGGAYCTVSTGGTGYDVYIALAAMPAGISPTMDPPDYNYHWSRVGHISNGRPDTGSGGVYDPGKIAETLQGGEMITKIADYNGTYMQVRSLRSVVGYVAIADCELTADAATGQVIPARSIKTQLFRIYEHGSDEDTGLYHVKARHISYDFTGNSLFDCQIEEADPASAVAIMQGALMFDDDRLIACDITGEKVSADWSFHNPVIALLDPENGLAKKLQARIIRDNKDYFILDNSNPRQGVTLEYGNNLTGVEWNSNIDKVVNRVVPIAGDGDGGYVYLDELFIDSGAADEFAVVRTQILHCDYSVGDKMKMPDGTEKTLTREDVIEKMRTDARDRFDRDSADASLFTLDVEFVLLGDTEEFRQYRGLQTLCLYDRVKVKTRTGVDASVQMTGYEWDCIRRRYNSASFGRVYAAMNRGVYGWQMPSNSITYTKLSAGLISKLKGSAE